MRRSVLTTLVLLASSVAFGQSYLVTLQVDLSNEVAIAPTVSVVGDFQYAAGYGSNWTPGTTVLTDPEGDHVFALTVTLPAGTYQYKFVNGDSWGQDEQVPAACSFGGSRQMVIASDTVLPVVCFGECGPCSPQVADVSVTLQVDMREETVTEMVSVAGDFQSEVVGETWSDWTPGQAILADLDGDDVYSITFVVPEGEYQYKHFNGSSWGQDESVPAACAVNGNRALSVVGPGPMVVPVHCFGSCLPCGTGAGTCDDPVTIACGETTAVLDTSSHVNNISAYTCVAWNESGPEVVFAFTVSAPSTDVTATLGGLTADLDVFLVDPNACSAGVCLAADSFGDTAAAATGLAPGTYLAVVDGFSGAAGPFHLHLQCAGGELFADGFEAGDTLGWSATSG